MSFSSIKISALPQVGPIQPGALIPAVIGGVTSSITIDAAAYIKVPVATATTTALPASTYANGTAGVGATLTANVNGAFPAVDGITLSVLGSRILVKDQSAPEQNGIYTLTQVGTGGTPWILTRATDFNQAADINLGATIPCTSGTINGFVNFIYTDISAPTLGTTALTFSGEINSSGDINVPAGSVVTANGFVATVAGAGFTLNPVTATGAAASPLTCNGRIFSPTFTSVSIAAGASLALTISNSAISGVSTLIDYTFFGVTAGASLNIESIVNSAGQSVVTFTNGAGATTSTADLTLIGTVLN